MAREGCFLFEVDFGAGYSLSTTSTEGDSQLSQTFGLDGSTALSWSECLGVEIDNWGVVCLNPRRLWQIRISNTALRLFCRCDGHS